MYFLVYDIHRHIHKCTLFTNGIKCMLELSMVPSKCCCPGVNDRQFTSVVVAAVAEPCELCDHVQIQGNGWSEWILGGRIDLTSPQRLTAKSTSL